MGNPRDGKIPKTAKSPGQQNPGKSRARSADPYVWLKRESNMDIRSISEFSYGSLLHAPFKTFAYYYILLGIRLVFLPKTRFFKVAFFLKIGLIGGKLKK